MEGFTGFLREQVKTKKITGARIELISLDLSYGPLGGEYHSIGSNPDINQRKKCPESQKRLTGNNIM
jgi:hypothetical protein